MMSDVDLKELRERTFNRKDGTAARADITALCDEVEKLRGLRGEDLKYCERLTVENEHLQELRKRLDYAAKKLADWANVDWADLVEEHGLLAEGDLL